LSYLTLLRSKYLNLVALQIKKMVLLFFTVIFEDVSIIDQWWRDFERWRSVGWQSERWWGFCFTWVGRARPVV